MSGFKGRVAAVVLAVLAAAVVGTGCGSGDGTAAEGQGQDPAAVKAAQRKALARYKQYLDREAGVLIGWTRKLEDRIARGDQFESTFGYTNSRVHYGHLQPAGRLLRRLDSQVNGDFHEIERTLYGKQTTEGLGPLAKQLVTGARRMRKALEGSAMPPPELARVSDQLMEEVTEEMMEGREAPNSRLDLIDVSASVEGVEKAFAVLEPQLDSEDPRLVAKIEDGFAQAYEVLSRHGSPARLEPGPEAGTFFVVYNYLEPHELLEISAPLDSLARLFGEVANRFDGG